MDAMTAFRRDSTFFAHWNEVELSWTSHAHGSSRHWLAHLARYMIWRQKSKAPITFR